MTLDNMPMYDIMKCKEAPMYCYVKRELRTDEGKQFDIDMGCDDPMSDIYDEVEEEDEEDNAQRFGICGVIARA
jgi:hypothetical protein